jgi:hypothetical protein
MLVSINNLTNQNGRPATSGVLFIVAVAAMDANFVDVVYCSGALAVVDVIFDLRT